MKRFYGWPEEAQFLVPDGVREHFAQGLGKRGEDLQRKWTGAFGGYQKAYPDLASQILQMQHRELPPGWDQDIPVFPADPKGVATRDWSAIALNAIVPRVPWLAGGPAGRLRRNLA